MSDQLKLEMPASEMARMRQWLKSMGAEVNRESRMIIQGALRRLHRMAIQDAPSDYSFLRGKIHIGFTNDKLGGMVYTGVRYAPYQEWGTGSRVLVPGFVKDMFGINAMDWKGRGIRRVNIKPHPYLFENARINYNEMILKIKRMGFK